MDNLKKIFVNLPGELGQEIRSLPDGILDNLEELHLKAGSPVFLYSGGREYFLEGGGAGIISAELINNVFYSLLKHSVYAYQEELAKGFITIEGGHRVGICGRTVLDKGEIKTIKDISSLNVRRSREILGTSDKCLPYILKEGGAGVRNTLIVSPPKCGKTTLLRDMIRSLSNKGFKVGLCDERSEISGVYRGIPAFDLGNRTDIMDGCPKSQGLMMLIRAMSPHIIATDEIGRASDVAALESALCAGIGVITTIHGSTHEDVLNSGIGTLIREGFFERFIYLTNSPRIGTIKKICGRGGETL